MSARRWWRMLDQWIRSQGLSREEVARRSGHEPVHVLAYFDDREPGARLRLFLDVVAAAGGRLSALGGNEIGDAVAYLERVRDEAGLSKAALAEAAGMFRPHLSRILHARSGNMALSTFDGLVSALGVQEAMVIVAREHGQQARSLIAVGGEVVPATTMKGAANDPGWLRVVSAPVVDLDDDVDLDEEMGLDDGAVDLRERLRIAEEGRRAAEGEEQRALARAKRAEQQAREAAQRVEELETLLQKERRRTRAAAQRTRAAERAAAEAMERADAEAERADEAVVFADAEVMRADQAVALAEAEHERADEAVALVQAETRRADQAELRLREEQARAAQDRRQADSAMQQVQQRLEQSEQERALLAERIPGWLSKGIYATGGALAGGALTSWMEKKARERSG